MARTPAQFQSILAIPPTLCTSKTRKRHQKWDVQTRH